MKYIMNIEEPIQKYRFTTQVSFTLLTVWIGIEFYLFVTYLESAGSQGSFYRPPGVDAFLPISSLMNLYYFLLTGEINFTHPAGLFILLAILTVSFVFGKSFCSYICPIGFLSELVGDFSEKIFKKKLFLPKWLDYPLRSLKYLLLAFFSYAIFFTMSALALNYFLDSPYNILADVKMYYFFANISQFALIVIAVLFILSILIRNFWCRFLCPYGALLGILSLLSPLKIKRTESKCINCNLCTKACPSNINVAKLKTVVSDECSTCLSCVDACPVSDTLNLTTIFDQKRFNKNLVPILLLIIFFIITGSAMISGYWHNKISEKEYFYLHKNIDNFGHPTSIEQTKKLNDEVLKKQ